MEKAKKIFFIFVLFMIGANAFAYQISFQVIQHDGENQKMNEKSLSVEDELFTGFFDKGYIVTNSKAVISRSNDQDGSFWTKGYGEAFDGFSDYFVQVKLYFSIPVKNENTGKIDQEINRICYNVTEVQTGETIADESIECSEKSGEDVAEISSVLVKNINKEIKAKA